MLYGTVTLGSMALGMLADGMSVMAANGQLCYAPRMEESATAPPFVPPMMIITVVVGIIGTVLLWRRPFSADPADSVSLSAASGVSKISSLAGVICVPFSIRFHRVFF